MPVARLRCEKNLQLSSPLGSPICCQHAGSRLTDYHQIRGRRRTAERMRDADRRSVHQLEEIERATETLAPAERSEQSVPRTAGRRTCALRGVARQLAHDGLDDSAMLLEAYTSKIEASLKEPARRRMLAPDVEALLEAEGFASRPGPRPVLSENHIRTYW